MTATRLTIPDLEQELWALLSQVPEGQVTTYGALAEALGNRVAARWVGQYLLHHDHHPECICHRVVRADGGLGMYIEGDAEAKARRLSDEGVTLEGSHVNLGQYAFVKFAGDQPLESLRRLQEEMAGKVSLSAPAAEPQLVAGIDVSYVNPETGVAAYALVDANEGELLWSATHVDRIRFPYISSYLGFRELPVLLALIEKAGEVSKLADVLMVDGSGIMHPRRVGIASQLGVMVDLPTIGVTKKLLCGTLDQQRLGEDGVCDVSEDGDLLGSAILPATHSKHPIYVSPGHGVDVEFATRVARRLLKEHRVPEPIFWADRLSRSTAGDLKNK